jgi:hypothetical protein
MVVKISFYVFIGHINLVCLVVYVTSFSHTKLSSFKLEFNWMFRATKWNSGRPPSELVNVIFL